MIDFMKPALASSAIVGLGAALAVGFGFVPSNDDMARVEAQAAQVSVIKTTLAVHGQRLDTIESGLTEIKQAQTIHFDKLMNKLERMERQR